MLTALILVCSIAAAPDPGACTRDNALEVMKVPATFASPVTCFMRGQAYLADSAIGRDLAANEMVKVVCVRSEAATGMIAPDQQERAKLSGTRVVR